MNYKAIFSFAIGLVLIFGGLNWPYWQATLFPPSPPPPPQAQEEILGPNLLYLPSLGIKVPLITPATNAEGDIQEALQNGVAHYPGTALPGATGNVYLVGHSSDNVWAKGNYKNVFANLPKLGLGDKIKISNEQGQVFIYEAVETKIVSPKDLSVLAQPTAEKLLTLQTSYPLGTALRRYLVIAKLIP